jgi:transposase InsO family protein
MTNGWLNLVVVMDWFSRYILSWELSNTLDTAFCVNALQAALEMGKPEIFNTDQGSQFTSSFKKYEKIHFKEYGILSKRSNPLHPIIF